MRSRNRPNSNSAARPKQNFWNLLYYTTRRSSYFFWFAPFIRAHFPMSVQFCRKTYNKFYEFRHCYCRKDEPLNPNRLRLRSIYLFTFFLLKQVTRHIATWTNQITMRKQLNQQCQRKTMIVLFKQDQTHGDWWLNYMEATEAKFRLHPEQVCIKEFT